MDYKNEKSSFKVICFNSNCKPQRNIYRAQKQKGLINLALIDLDKRDKTAHAKNYLVNTSPKCAEYLFKNDCCSSCLINCY